MHDAQNGRLRYLIYFDDGGSGMRRHDEPLALGDELRDGGDRYRVERVDAPPNPMSFGHVWATRIESAS